MLSERFEQLRAKQERAARGAAKTALADPRVYQLDSLTKPARAGLVRFWEAWQDELTTIRLLDPACGSGAFLIEAFDQLHATYERSNDRLAELRGHRTLFDLDKRILEHNLYGVDLNEEAIEICRLSLWIKTAERGKALTSLDHPIREGNSVVADLAVHPKAFDWQRKLLLPMITQGSGIQTPVLVSECTQTLRSKIRCILFDIGICNLNLDDVVLPRKEGIQDFWIELRTASLTHDGEAFFQCKRRLVRSLATQGIEHIGNGCDPAFKRNVLPSKAKRVAGAIPAFVVGQGNFHGKFQNW